MVKSGSISYDSFWALLQLSLPCCQYVVVIDARVVRIVCSVEHHQSVAALTTPWWTSIESAKSKR